MLSWRHFLDEEHHQVVEEVALTRRTMSIATPESFEWLCADTLWALSPQAAMNHSLALILQATLPGSLEEKGPGHGSQPQGDQPDWGPA